MDTLTAIRKEITVRGRVQGVGFRPLVYRLANDLGLSGYVYNFGPGVFITLEGPGDRIGHFSNQLRAQLPSHATITDWEESIHPLLGLTGFTIAESPGGFPPEADITPDLATCPDCLKELFDPADRRYLYPFINCTACGPRFSIIEALPYDRPRTTMKDFMLCPACSSEYHDPVNRRFHAQPVACPDCGPAISLVDRQGHQLSAGNKAIREACDLILNGNLVALKGLGGFQLLCDATSDEAVRLLRHRKHREEKPFAVMIPDETWIDRVVICNSTGRDILTSQAAPIVLLPALINHGISPLVHPGNPNLGVMLPYTPLHHLIMRQSGRPLVATSGNRSDEPICIDNQEALDRLGDIADVFLIHNRPIRRPVDDSVVRVVAGRTLVMRRARGFAPIPIRVEPTSQTTLAATGGFLKNTVALLAGEKILISQHIGDLSTEEAIFHHQAVLDDIGTLYDLKPTVWVTDLHPDYPSTRTAQGRIGTHVSVQHHIAHLAACRLEFGVKGKALGFSWDGTGLADDGSIAGSEIVLTDDHEIQPIGRFLPFSLPGGDSAARNVWKPGLSLLMASFGNTESEMEPLISVWPVKKTDLAIYRQLLGRPSVQCSSAGRIFDGLSACLGLSFRNSFEGQAAMALEFASRDCQTSPYSWNLIENNPFLIDWRPMIRSAVSDHRKGVSAGEIGYRFHLTLADMICSIAVRHEVKQVLLTGGCFQNQLLLNLTLERLETGGFTVFIPQQIPLNDGGLSAGQVAACHFGWLTPH